MFLDNYPRIRSTGALLSTSALFLAVNGCGGRPASIDHEQSLGTSQPNVPQQSQSALYHENDIKTILSGKNIDAHNIRLLAEYVHPTQNDVTTEQGEMSKPVSAVETIKHYFGTDFNLSGVDTPKSASGVLVDSGKFTDITSEIAPDDLPYLPAGLIVISSNSEYGYRLAISTGPDPYNQFAGRSGLANAIGVEDIQEAIDTNELQYVIAPNQVKTLPDADAPIVTSSPKAITHGSSTINEVALTFDADMTPEMELLLRQGKVKSWYNRKVIDVLEQYHVPATLFMTGLWAKNYPTEAKQLADNPLFEIGDHSYKHYAFTDDCYGLPSIPDAEDDTEIKAAQQAIKTATALTPTLFRFAGLCHDNNDLQKVSANGLKTIDGTASGDAGNPDTQSIVDNVVNTAKNGSIIVFHMHGDGGFKTGYAPKSAEALESIIPKLQREFRFVKVSHLLEDAH